MNRVVPKPLPTEPGVLVAAPLQQSRASQFPFLTSEENKSRILSYLCCKYLENTGCLALSFCGSPLQFLLEQQGPDAHGQPKQQLLQSTGLTFWELTNVQASNHAWRN